MSIQTPLLIIYSLSDVFPLLPVVPYGAVQASGYPAATVRLIYIFISEFIAAVGFCS
jgi:hypothetical protein